MGFGKSRDVTSMPFVLVVDETLNAVLDAIMLGATSYRNGRIAVVQIS